MQIQIACPECSRGQLWVDGVRRPCPSCDGTGLATMTMPVRSRLRGIHHAEAVIDCETREEYDHTTIVLYGPPDGDYRPTGSPVMSICFQRHRLDGRAASAGGHTVPAELTDVGPVPRSQCYAGRIQHEHSDRGFPISSPDTLRRAARLAERLREASHMAAPSECELALIIDALAILGVSTQVRYWLGRRYGYLAAADLPAEVARGVSAALVAERAAA